MAEAFTQVQAVLGTDSPISDKQIRDALWDSYFDVDGSIAHLLGTRSFQEMLSSPVRLTQSPLADEQHKKEARKQKEQGEASAPSDSTNGLHSTTTADAQASNLEPQASAPATGDRVPTASLAQLSLRDSSVATAPPPRNKLAAKVAANKMARAAQAAPPSSAVAGGAESDSPAATPMSTEPAQPEAPTGGSAAAPPEKKLSKLQQKMLAAKAAKAAAGGGARAAVSAAGTPPAPRPGAFAAKGSDAPLKHEEDKPEEPVVLPMQLDGAPSMGDSPVATSSSLFAAPSAFAVALAPPPASSSLCTHAPSEPSRLGSGHPALGSVALRIASAAPVLAGSANMRERFGPSPDDKVLAARKGTALGGAGAGASGGAVKRQAAAAKAKAR